MSDAPERIWRSSGRMWYFEPPENLQTVEYIRADILEKTVTQWLMDFRLLGRQTRDLEIRLEKAVIALEEIAGSLSDEGRLAESALKELETDHV